MKTYKIINTDIMHKGKLFPEGSTINLDDKDAEILSAYLVTVGNNANYDASAPEVPASSSTVNNNSNKNKKRNK